MRAREFTQEGVRDIVNWGRNVINQSDRDAPIVMMTNPRNQGAVTNTGRGMRIQDFPLRMVPVDQLRPWEPMTKMRDLPSQRTVASLRQALRQGDKIPPLLVTPVRGGYRIIDGHHRYAALLQTGMEQAPVRVVDPRLIRYSDEVMEALKITLERYGHKRRRTNENRTATVVLDGGEQRQIRYVPGRGDWMDWIIAYYWRQNRQVQSIDGHDIDWDDDAEVVTQENTAGIDIGQEWMTDTELDQYVPDDLQQEWRELVGYDEDGNAHPLWANITGDYEPDVSDPQHRAWMVKVANRWFTMKRIPNVRFFAVRDADDELEWLVQIGPQAMAESLDQPYRIKWARSMHGDYDALATLDDGTYLSIMFNNESKNNWMVEFYRNNRQEVTGEGDAQRVFATVLTAIAQFIEKKKPVSLFFSAVKEDDPKGSREKLYDRLVQRYAGSLGYTIHQGRTPMGSKTYKFTRKQQGVAEGVDTDTFEELDAGPGRDQRRIT